MGKCGKFSNDQFFIPRPPPYHINRIYVKDESIESSPEKGQFRVMTLDHSFKKRGGGVRDDDNVKIVGNKNGLSS